MKKGFLFTAVAFIALGFMGCSDDDGGGSSITSDGKISGTLTIIEEYYDDDDEMYKYEIKESVSNEVDEIALCSEESSSGYDVVLEKFAVSNGKFTITLPSSISSKYLENVMDEFEYEIENGGDIQISDEDANLGFIWFASLKNDEVNGYVDKTSYSNGAYTGEVLYVYVDRGVTIKGTYVNMEEYTDITYTYINEYDVKFNKGWNTLVAKRTLNTTNTTWTSTWKYTANSSESGMIWTVELDGNLRSAKSDADKTKGFSKRFLNRK